MAEINMKLFYGADHNLKTPIYGLGNPSNDYGLGFYMTPSKEAARLWASRFKDGWIITYNLDFKKLNILYLNNNTEEDVLKWITILVKHRFDNTERVRYKDVINWLISKFDVDLSLYDMVVGYRADDSYFSYSVGFVSGDISLETLMEAMKIGKLGLQYALLSKKAFSCIKFVSSEKALENNDYEKFRKSTLNEYHEPKNKEDRFNNTFIGEIMKKYGK